MIIGIDLGTTNSAVGVWRDGKAELIPNSLGHFLTPSVVSIDDQGEVIVGLAARERHSTHPEQTAAAFKRFMGTTRALRLGDAAYLPEEISALVLRSLKADAEAYLGQAVTEAIIAVPAYFNDKQRKATRRAGELAGLTVARLINEPTAAALAYGVHQHGAEARFLVFDLGGGTFDVSIIELFDGVIEVRASTGDNRLGGEDFNELLIDRARASWSEQLGADLHDPSLYQKMRSAAERAKRQLSLEPEATLSVVWKGQSLQFVETADAFDSAAVDLLQRLREPVLRALRDGNLRAESLDEIVLVGGATRMPMVRRAVTRMFGRFPGHTVDPDEAVARGAAIQAGLKARDSALDEVVLTDVCPYSLGVNVGERGPNGAIRTGIFSPIIERNTVVPASRAHTFATLHDNQASIDLAIYQGESRWVAENIRLGEINMTVPPKPAGEALVECRFTYDINGLLEVDVQSLSTGERRQLVIVDDEVSASEDFEARRVALAQLKLYPRDEDANRAALSRAGRCYEDALGDLRQQIGELISRFEANLDRQDPRSIAMARVDLLAALDAVEGRTNL